MFGITELILPVALISSLIAVGTDLAWGKIYNWLTLPVLFLGVAVSGMESGFGGFLSSLSGVAVAFIILIPLFLPRWLGAGDVKFMMAIGAWVGISDISQAIAIGFSVGAIFSVIALVSKNRLTLFLTKIYVFLISLMSRGMKIEFPEFTEKTKIPFSMPLSIGVIWTLMAHPLKGVLFW